MPEEESVILMKLSGGGWTFPPSPVPRILAAAGVPEDVWSTTYEKALEHQARFENVMNDYRTTNKWASISWLLSFFVMLTIMFHMQSPWWALGVGCVPIAVLYGVKEFRGRILGKEGSKTQQNAEIIAWIRLIEEQKGVYQPFGITCKLIKSPVVVVGGGRQMKLLVGGIQFKKIAAAASAGAAVPEPKSIARELESLRDLHKSGALTDEEFSQAKARVLTENSSSTAETVISSGGPTLAYAEVVHDGSIAISDAGQNIAKEQEKSLLEFV